MSKLAILRHVTRGREVIELLEMLGGKNIYHFNGDEDEWFVLNSNIQRSDRLFNEIVFSLEEFLEKFPYKVGDKVSSKYLKNYKIEKMEWGDINNRVIYKLQGMGWYNVDELQPYKEEIMKDNIIDTVKENDNRYRIILNYQYDIEVDEGEYYVVRKKPQYPKTLSECCDILGVDLSNCEITGYEDFKLEFLQGLLICRDAYWKIAGDWRPDWNNDSQFKYIITCRRYNIIKDTYTALNSILSFPTKEMRDAFYENFREDIEQCKELL